MLRTQKADITRMILKYKAAFSNTDMTKEKVLLYAELLQDVPIDKLEQAMIACAKSMKFFPTVSELRATAREMMSRPTVITDIEEYKRQQDEKDKQARAMMFRALGEI